MALVSDDVYSRFAADPVRVMRADLGLTVTPVQRLSQARSDGGACDGVSFLEDGVVLYAPTPGSRRENFTLAHEVGHWLVDQEPSVYDWIANQDDPQRMLETICDRIAQRLLLNEAMVDAVVVAGPVRAHHVPDLYSASQASRPVCAIALAKRLPGPGAVVLIDHQSGEVTHASVNPDPDDGWPTVYPWRQQVLDRGHPLLALGEGGTTTRRLTWRMPWKTQADFYVDAVADYKRVFAVLVARDIWGVDPFAPVIDREFDKRPVMTVHCCGSTSKVRGYPCSACGEPFCPKCGHCRCQKVAEREVLCSGGCFLKYLPHLLIEGLCPECRG